MRRATRGAIAWLLLCLLPITAGSEERIGWSPVDVQVWEPPFNAEHARRDAVYRALPTARRPWQICVSLPHLSPYWMPVNFGLVAEARALGVRLSLFEAELDPALQRGQVRRCVEEGYDALIVAPIEPEDLLEELRLARREGLPVLNLINPVAEPLADARVAGDFFDAGFSAGDFLRQRHAASTAEPARVAWFPGYLRDEWSAAADAGFREALADSNVEIALAREGAVERWEQQRLLERVLDEHSDSIDYIVGTAPTAEAAIRVLRQRGLSERIAVVSYYLSAAVHRGVRRGVVLAAVSDQQVLQARMAVDISVRMLEGREHLQHVAPRPIVLTADSVRGWDVSTSLTPRGFQPIFNIGVPSDG